MALTALSGAALLPRPSKLAREDAKAPAMQHLLGFSKERTMWKVSDVEPVRVMGAEGYPYGFNVTTEDGKPVVSFAYASRALAEAGATHLESALLNAISVHPYAE